MGAAKKAKQGLGAAGQLQQGLKLGTTHAAMMPVAKTSYFGRWASIRARLAFFLDGLKVCGGVGDSVADKNAHWER